MKKKLVLVMALTLVALVVFPVVASADVFEGEGSITARGVGVAIVHGEGEVEIVGHGIGLVHVRNATRLEASGRGYRRDLPGGGAVFMGWRGEIHAAGTELKVRMCGGLIEFTAEGTGWVFLRGRGTYEINGESYDWSTEGARVSLGEVEE